MVDSGRTFRKTKNRRIVSPTSRETQTISTKLGNFRKRFRLRTAENENLLRVRKSMKLCRDKENMSNDDKKSTSSFSLSEFYENEL